MYVSSVWQVTGEANETQICESLLRYSERDGFVREALFHLFSLTHVMEKPRPDILKVHTHCVMSTLPFTSKYILQQHGSVSTFL